MLFVDFVHGARLLLAPAVVASPRVVRLGRAWATVLRREAALEGAVVIARSDDEDDEQRALRDALVCGLVQSGRDVVDLGIADEELVSFALGSSHSGLACVGGALLGSTGEELTLDVFSGPSRVTPQAMEILARCADEGCFAVGCGVVSSVSLRGRMALVGPLTLELGVRRTSDDTREGSPL